MKKSLIRVAFAAALVVIAGYGVYTNQRETDSMSELMLANVEALANCESTSHYTGAREYQAENRCICLSCPEPDDDNCTCLNGD